VWIGAKDGLLYKEAMYDEKGVEIMSLEYSEVQLNIPLKDDEFSFTPPEWRRSRRSSLRRWEYPMYRILGAAQELVRPFLISSGGRIWALCSRPYTESC